MALTILSLYMATGTMVAQYYCGMPMTGLAIHTGTNNCCDGILTGEKQFGVVVGHAVHNHRDSGRRHDDCNTHECSHNPGTGYYNPTEIITVKKTFLSDITSAVNMVVSDFADVIVKRADSQTTRFLSNFSIPGIKIDFRVIYGVFIC